MLTHHLSRSVGCLMAVAMIHSGHPAEATKASFKAGDLVVTRRKAPLMDGATQVLLLEAATEVTATEVKGRWVALTISQDGKKVAGWIDTAHLVRAGDNIKGTEPSLNARIFSRRDRASLAKEHASIVKQLEKPQSRLTGNVGSLVLYVELPQVSEPSTISYKLYSSRGRLLSKGTAAATVDDLWGIQKGDSMTAGYSIMTNAVEGKEFVRTPMSLGVKSGQPRIYVRTEMKPHARASGLGGGQCRLYLLLNDVVSSTLLIE